MATSYSVPIPNGQSGEAIPVYTRKDFVSDQEVRWCPGCGDYSILAQMQKMLPDLGIKKEDLVFISGIGCSSRFPYYIESYGFHSIHGRALTLATGLKSARPELTVFVVTGDGDGLSIGGNHLLHAMRRNLDITVVLFNNRIYGLTKGQYSPTSEMGKITKSSPYGTTESPLSPIRVALAAGATFVARTVDRDTRHLEETLLKAAQHKGTSFVEVYQNCNVFNDGAFAAFVDKDVRADRMLYVEDGQPLRFGADRQHGIRLDGFVPQVVHDVESDEGLLVHDVKANQVLANILVGMDYPEYPVPVGVFRAVEAPLYEDMLQAQVDDARGHGVPDFTDLHSGGNPYDRRHVEHRVVSVLRGRGDRRLGPLLQLRPVTLGIAAAGLGAGSERVPLRGAHLRAPLVEAGDSFAGHAYPGGCRGDREQHHRRGGHRRRGRSDRHLHGPRRPPKARGQLDRPQWPDQRLHDARPGCPS
jgi:2-oxoglutarate ferredoxin oxidoreductase subunit beta